MSLSSKNACPYLKAIWLAALWIPSVAPVHAGTSGPGAPLPGLESDPPDTVLPRSCSVTVAADQVTVDLSVRTQGDMPALFLEGPLFGWIGEANPYPDRHFPELEIHVDNPPEAPNDRFEAWMGKTNITNLIWDAGMDPWAVARTPPSTQAHPKNPQVLNGLRHLGAVEQVDDNYLAKWRVRRILRIPLNAAPEQQVQLRYAARPAHGSSNLEELVTPERARDYCVSLKQLRGTLRGARGASYLDAVEYAIPTQIDGHSPSSVTLTLSAGVADRPTAIFLCGPHGKSIAKRGPVTRQPAQVDEHGVLHVLSVVEPSTKSR